MISIENLRKTKLEHPWDFRCDRGSPLGNPHFLANEKDREGVCQAYKQLFPYLINGVPGNYLAELIAAYKKHGKLRLFCWCAPKQCHVETIRDHIYEIQSNT